MPKGPEERRRYSRYDSHLKIDFEVNFDIETRIDYRIKSKEDEKFSLQKYQAVSNNINAEGINFTSHRKLNKGDRLRLNLYVPASENPVVMEGEVRWCSKSIYHKDEKDAYDTGVEVHIVNDQVLRSTIAVDKENNVVWSLLLDSVFSHFKHAVQKRKK